MLGWCSGSLGPVSHSYEHSNELQGDLQAEEVTAQRTLCNMQSSAQTCDTCE